MTTPGPPDNPASKPPLLLSVFKMKCPCCRKGAMFLNKSIFPFAQLLDMPEQCAVCGQKMELEPGFYYGTGYVSYGLSVGLTFMMAILFAFTWGFDWRDNSIFWFLGIDVALLIILQPWLMRISRVLYLYMFVKYGKEM
jgi:hypothetical protein